MRWRLIDKAPLRVARSLSDEWADEHDEAWRMREALADEVPTDVAMTLGRLDSDRAWAMRDRLKRHGAAASQVLASLKGFDSERAWTLRDELTKKKTVPGLLRGLAYLDNERSWTLREKHQKNALPWVILSLIGCESERAYALRRRYIDTATKLVMRSLAGSVEPEAWEMRKRAGAWAREALTTIKNIDTEEAWALRRSLAETWPGPAAKSVGLTLALIPKGYDFILDLATRFPHNPDVLHYLVKAIEVKKGRDE
jgi:dTMP kinase